MRKALVTGAEGFIGSHLVRFLQARGWIVFAGYLTRPRPLSRVRSLEWVACDLRDRQRVARLIRDIQPTHIFHLGAQSLPTLSREDPVGTFQSNIMGSLHLFEAVRCSKRPVKVISACSSAEYGEVPASAIPASETQCLRPLHPYGVSKVCLDLLARQYFLDYKIPAVNLRVFNTTGPGKINDAPSDFVRQLVRIRNGLQPPVLEAGNLKSRRAFLDVDDSVRGFYAAALRGRPGEAYNLCGRTAYRIGELLRIAIGLSGVKVQVRRAERLLRPHDEKIIFGDTRKFRKDTGWKPRKSLQQTLASMLDYWDRVL